MNQEEKHREQRHGTDFRRAMIDPRVWFLILLYSTVAFSSNAGGLYLPELIRNRFPDSNKLEIGLLGGGPQRVRADWHAGQWGLVGPNPEISPARGDSRRS